MSEGTARAQGRSSEKDEAVVTAYRLIYEIQSAVPDAATRLRAHVAEASVNGYREVVLAGIFGQAVEAWLLRDTTAGEHVETLVEQAVAEGDQVMLALGLGLRSDQGFSGYDPSLSAERDADLARAIVLLEEAQGPAAARITAHTACAIALCNRSFFELGDAQYALALEIGGQEPPGTLDFLLSPILFNLAENQVSWASELRQLGREKELTERWEAWRQAESTARTAYELPEAWRVELEALGLVLGAIAGKDSSTRAMALLFEVVPNEATSRTTALLKLAVAISLVDADRNGADQALEEAIAAVDGEVHPHLYDLALYLRAAREAGPASAGITYARRQFERAWATRLSALGALNSRIQAERLSTERELLTRHARLDDLTEIGNRRALDLYLRELSNKDVSEIALILLDVNNFKSVNDKHGHLAGDAVLIGIARLLADHVRANDLAVRLGGDEFAVVLEGADIDVAFERATSLLAQFDDSSFAEVSPDLEVTLSAGVAAGAPPDLTELWSKADTALYRAKAGAGERLVRSVVARPETDTM